MITSHRDNRADLTVHVCRGKISLGEIIDEIKSFYDKEPTQNNLWDLTEADISELSSSEIKAIANFAKGYNPSRVGGKTAFVSPQDVAFGLSRMYGTFADLAEQEVDLMVFRSLEDAMKWIRG